MRRVSLLGVLRWTGLAMVATTAIAVASALFDAQAAVANAAPDAAADAKADKNGTGGAPAATSPEKKSPGKKAKGERAKPRGRLPAHFSGVVTDEQREKIYAIQKEYEPKISQLRQELDDLTKARDDRVHAVLSPEQKKKVDDLKAAAKQSREKKGAAEPAKEPKKESKPSKAEARAKPATPATKPEGAESVK